MAVAASPPPEDLTPQQQELSDSLDEDIARVRAEIESLAKRKDLLVSSLLSSTKIQAQLASHNPNPNRDSDSNRLIAEQSPLQIHAQHNQTNIHRLAYGVTSFPFTDPNPDTSDKPLLGVRFDIPSRTGKFEKAPYYIFFKRTDENDKAYNTTQDAARADHDRRNNLKIHHHTIPALVPLQDYEARYLPQPGSQDPSDGARVGEDDDEDDIPAQDSSGPGRDASIHDAGPAQDLHALVAAVRQDLMSWQLRTDAIALTAERLGLTDTGKGAGRLSIQSVEATAVDARFCRLVWQSGTVGRLRLTDEGYIDRAVVIGDTGEGGQPDRMKDLERMLTSSQDGGKLKLVDLAERLESVERKSARRGLKLQSETAVEPGNYSGMELDD